MSIEQPDYSFLFDYAFCGTPTDFSNKSAAVVKLLRLKY